MDNVKFNNPFNIRYSKVNNWLGQIGENKGFCKFDTMEHGIRAFIKLCINYSKSGINTASSFVHRYCPNGDGLNDEDKYVSFLLSNYAYFCPTNRQRFFLFASSVALYESNYKLDLRDFTKAYNSLIY